MTMSDERTEDTAATVAPSEEHHGGEEAREAEGETVTLTITENGDLVAEGDEETGDLVADNDQLAPVTEAQTQIVTVSEGQVVEGDILQAALQEVTGGTPPPVAEGEEGAGVEEGGAGQQERDDAGQATTLPEASVGDGATGSDGGNVRYVTAGHNVEAHIVSTEELEHYRLVPTEPAAGVEGTGTPAGRDAQSQQRDERSGEPSGTGGGGSGVPTTVKVLSNANNPAPLGSSLNPIRIVQQGNQYTSAQQLDKDQLQQIMEVVQRQQQLIRKGGSPGPSQTVIYNPASQTRIVYKVIYPSELHKGGTAASQAARTPSSTPGSSGARRTIQVPSDILTVTPASGPRKYRRRRADDEERLDVPELTHEEKEAKKSTRPKTRFGRVSKPPKHMVKDYKQIHLVDWDEDFDDSDGGYSDFRGSDTSGSDDEDNAIREFYRKNYGGSYQNFGGKPRRFKCEKCEKAYIGPGGLARHYRMTPGHGDPDAVLKDAGNNDAAKEADGGPGSDAGGGDAGGSAPTDTADNGETRNNSHDTNAAATPRTSAPSPGSSSSSRPAPPTGRRPGRPPGRPPGKVLVKPRQQEPDPSPARRKARLKELMRQCDDEELMEVVLPRLSKVITTYEFLLMRVERGKPLVPHVQDVLVEFEKLHKQVSKMCTEYLRPVDSAQRAAGQVKNVLQVKESSVAQGLGLNTGTYEILDQPISGENVTARPKAPRGPDKQQPAASGGKRASEEAGLEDSAGPAKKAKTDVPQSIVRVTSEGLKLIEPSAAEKGGPVQVVGNSVGVSPAKPATSSAVSGQRVYVVSSPSAAGATLTLQAPEPHVLPAAVAAPVAATSYTTTSNMAAAISHVTQAPNDNGVMQVANTAAVVNFGSEGEQQQGAGGDGEEAEKVVRVVTMEGAEEEEEGEAQGGETEVVEQQQLMPGEILQVRDTDGHILHVTAGENGELIQVDPSALPMEAVQHVQGSEAVSEQHQLQVQEPQQQEAQQGEVYSAEDGGLILIQSEDGSIQVHGNSDQPIPLETVQALLTMEDGHVIQQ